MEKLKLKDVKGNYEREYKYQQLYRSVDFAERKPKLSATSYFYIVHTEYGSTYSFSKGYLGHMEQHMIENPKHTIYWLEPESEWFVELYEKGMDENDRW